MKAKGLGCPPPSSTQRAFPGVWARAPLAPAPSNLGYISLLSEWAGPQMRLTTPGVGEVEVC